jgi:hypothetical protein
VADALTETGAPPVEAASAPPAPARAKRRTFRFQFGLANILLAAVVGAAVGSFIVLLGRPTHDEKAWSAWQPSGNVTERADQIVKRIGGGYKLADGSPLVGIQYGPPFVQDGNTSRSVVGFDVAKKSKTRFLPDEAVFDATGTIEYVLCGLSSEHKCAVAGGPPTPQQGLLLGREALELALYSFRYIAGTQAVFMLLPPNGKTSNAALFWRKSDLEDALSHPLRNTLPARPAGAQTLSAIESRVIGRLVSPYVVKIASYQQASNNAVIAVLTP